MLKNAPMVYVTVLYTVRNLLVITKTNLGQVNGWLNILASLSQNYPKFVANIS